MKKVLIIDPDPASRGQLSRWLAERESHIIEAADAHQGLALTTEQKPAIILCDFAALGLDAFLHCQKLRGPRRNASEIPVIVALGGFQIADKAHALEAGADEYVAKPIELEALDKVLAHISGRSHPDTTHKSRTAHPPHPHHPRATRIKFWGVRGSIPSPGPSTVFYGGNTSCIELRIGSDIIILDAGTGLRSLGLALANEFKEQPMSLNLLITHTHWDHIQGFPFFLPAYNPKNSLTVIGFEGASQGLQGTLSLQMESPYFPISMQQMPGHITIRKIHDLNFKVGHVPVRAHFLNHPGICNGYRLSTPGGSISYLPDVELFQRLRARWNADTETLRREEKESSLPEDQSLVDFIRDSDVLIMDSQYDAAEYEKHVGWGHSCLEDSVAFALHAKVKRLFLFHHDPDHTDDQIARMVARARQMVARRHSNLIVEAAREGCELILTPEPALECKDVQARV